MTRILRRIAVFVVLFSCSIVLTIHADEIVLGPADFLATDQPRATIAMEYPVNSGVQVTDGIEFFLDTGTSGIMFAMGSYDGDPNAYHVQHRTDGSVVQYLETGIAGDQLLDVFEPHDFYFAGDDGTPFELPNVRPYGSIDVDLGDINGLAGMPTMVGRVVHMDLRTQLGTGDGFPGLITTSFESAPTAPAANSQRYHVALRMDPPSFPGVDPDHPNDPTPTFAHIPFVTGLGHTFIDHSGQTHTVYRDAVLDTGAQVSIISHQLALDLGINLNPNDPNTDIEDTDGDGKITADDYFPIGGLGGEVSIPFVHLSKISIPTKEGTYLSMTDLDVGVFVDPDGNSLDIPGLDSIFGMNILTSGYFNAIFGDGSAALLNEVSLDFRDLNNAEMLLDVNLDAPEPGGVVVLLASFGLLIRPKRRLHV